MASESVSFSNTQLAFAGKSDKDLNRSHWLFRLIGNPALVRVFSKLTIWSMKMGLPVQGIIKSTIFRHFCGGESIDESKSVIGKLYHAHVGSILDYSIEGKEDEKDFETVKNELIRIINTAKENPAIPYTSVKLTGTARFALLEKLSKTSNLTEEEQEEYKRVKARLDEVCHAAYKAEVPIYIDAEESWIQEAIDDLALEMMRRYNTKKAIVQTTLQMYRKDRLEYLGVLIEIARVEKFFLGVKLVRGAYWEKENERAEKMNYPTPVHPTKELTDRDFDAAAEMCLKNIEFVSLCAGTHNEESTMRIVDLMERLGIRKGDKRVYFSQLFGMSDHISFNLAASGFNVTKYLPYGPVKSVIPYLIRRAQENTAIAGQMGRELRLITEEKKRRDYLRFLKRAGKREQPV